MFERQVEKGAVRALRPADRSPWRWPSARPLGRVRRSQTSARCAGTCCARIGRCTTTRRESAFRPIFPGAQPSRRARPRRSPQIVPGFPHRRPRRARTSARWPAASQKARTSLAACLAGAVCSLMTSPERPSRFKNSAASPRERISAIRRDRRRRNRRRPPPRATPAGPPTSGIGTPVSAPVATADMMSLRNVRMSSVMSAFSPLSTPVLLLSQPQAVALSGSTSSICSRARPCFAPERERLRDRLDIGAEPDIGGKLHRIAGAVRAHMHDAAGHFFEHGRARARDPRRARQPWRTACRRAPVESCRAPAPRSTARRALRPAAPVRGQSSAAACSSR